MLKRFFQTMPLMAILRGVKPDEVLSIAEVLVDAGFVAIEVPLNSPEPYKSIKLLNEKFGAEILTGAGTVLSTDQVDAVADAGGKLIVMPHSDVKIIEYTAAKNLCCIPGCATVTEAFAAINAGASALKIFPASMVSAQTVKAWCAVLPKDIPLLPVGGVGAANFSEYYTAGANGFGLGSSLYKPGDSVDKVRKKAEDFIAAWRTLA